MKSLLVINYRSAALAATAIASARAASASPLEVVVVDNTCDGKEADALRPHADTLITPSDNLGYAGGINEGRRHCHGNAILVINPDVEFAHGAVDALFDAVGEGRAAVAGPSLYWDRAFKWHLPPADLFTAAEKLDEAIATRSRLWARARDRRRFRARLHFWSASQTTDVRALSGAVMAIRTSVFDRVGGFDDRFRLYFEENDFLRRIAATGERIAYVPGARCRHVYNQSAATDATRAAEMFAASEEKYLEKWNGRFVTRVLKRIARQAPDIAAEPFSGEIHAPSGSVIEASPLATFATAAGIFSNGTPIALPLEVAETYRGERIYLRVVDAASANVQSVYVRYRT